LWGSAAVQEHRIQLVDTYTSHCCHSVLVAELHNIIYQLNTLLRISKQGTSSWQSRINGQQRGSSFMWDTLNGNKTWMWASTVQSIAWQARAHFTV
jgi:hypothetical protein